MRRITALGLGALALCGVIGTTAGTANADATVGQALGDIVGTLRQAPEPPPIGKKHHFHYWITGSDITGVWYMAMNNGKKDHWLKFTLRHTKDDHQQAAICAKSNAGSQKIFCAATTTAKGATHSESGFVFLAHLHIKAALGHTDQTDPTDFIAIKNGLWHKLF